MYLHVGCTPCPQEPEGLVPGVLLLVLRPAAERRVQPLSLLCRPPPPKAPPPRPLLCNTPPSHDQIQNMRRLLLSLFIQIRVAGSCLHPPSHDQMYNLQRLLSHGNSRRVAHSYVTMRSLIWSICLVDCRTAIPSITHCQQITLTFLIFRVWLEDHATLLAMQTSAGHPIHLCECLCRSACCRSFKKQSRGSQPC